jgi:hypothetical protein
MIFHDALPHIPWMDPQLKRLPGIMPLQAGDWLRKDEVYGAQMALRDQLIRDSLGAVHVVLPQAKDAAREVLQMGLARLGHTGPSATRVDGVQVAIDWDQPLITLGRLVQEDICILQDDGAQYCLTGAILCFPASWTLAQKIGRPMMAIHTPVDSYTDEMGARVHRMFSALRPDQGLWRMNYMTYGSADLHHPRLENDPRPPYGVRPYLRAERQCLIRLPRTRAVVFSIHTYLMRIADLDAEARDSLLKLHP